MNFIVKSGIHSHDESELNATWFALSSWKQGVSLVPSPTWVIRWWLPLGMMAFIAGLAVSMVLFGQIPFSWSELFNNPKAKDDREAASGYAETMWPPPSDVVIPVPIVPDMPGVPSS